MIFYGFYYGILVERIFLWFLWFFTCHICGNGFCSFFFQSLMVFMVFMIFMILNFLFMRKGRSHKSESFMFRACVTSWPRSWWWSRTRSPSTAASPTSWTGWSSKYFLIFPFSIASACVKEASWSLMNWMYSRNFPTGDQMDHNFANMRVLMQVTNEKSSQWKIY